MLNHKIIRLKLKGSSKTLKSSSSMESIKNISSSLPLVEFKDINCQFLVGTPIPLRYTISESHTPSSLDWIGLFRIGWKSHGDYVTYVYAPAPSRCGSGKDYEVAFDFPEKSLPEDDGYSYQFCYISNRQVLGISNSFEFKEYLIEDLLECDIAGQSFVECKFYSVNKDLAESFSSSQQEKQNELQSKIRDYELQMSKLSENIASMEKEKQILTNKKVSLNLKLAETESRVSNLNDILNSMKEENLKAVEESSVLNIKLDFAKEKVVEEERRLVEKRNSYHKSFLQLQEKRIEIKQLDGKIKDSNAVAAQLQNTFERQKNYYGKNLANVEKQIGNQNNTLALEKSRSEELKRKLEETCASVVKSERFNEESKFQMIQIQQQTLKDTEIYESQLKIMETEYRKESASQERTIERICENIISLTTALKDSSEKVEKYEKTWGRLMKLPTTISNFFSTKSSLLESMFD